MADYANLFKDYTPTANNGDQIKNLSTELASFGFSPSFVRDPISIPAFYQSKIAKILYLPKDILENEDCHSFYKRYSPASMTHHAYAQRAMTYRFLDTCEYLVNQKKLSPTVRDECRTLLYSNILGNRVLCLVNFANLYNYITKYPEPTLRPHFFSNIMMMRALTNWTYADYCSNLQNELPNARNLLGQCARAETRYSTYIFDTANKLNEQFNYTFDRLYNSPSSLYSLDNVQKTNNNLIYNPVLIIDGGKYDYFKKSIEFELKPPVKDNFYRPQDKSQF